MWLKQYLHSLTKYVAYNNVEWKTLSWARSSGLLVCSTGELTVAAFDECEKTSPCPCVETWFWKNSATDGVLNGKQPCRVTENTHSLYCCLADEVIGQIVFTVIHEWIPLLVLSHHGSYVTFCIFPMADHLSRKCNLLNVSWLFFVSAFRGLKVFDSEMSDFRCQATICYHLLETVGLDLSIGEQNVRVQKSMQNEVWVFVCVVVVGGYTVSWFCWHRMYRSVIFLESKDSCKNTFLKFSVEWVHCVWVQECHFCAHCEVGPETTIAAGCAQSLQTPVLN